MAAAKALLGQFSQHPDWQEQNDIAIEALIECWNSTETKQGIEAFFDKQPAPWRKG